MASEQQERIVRHDLGAPLVVIAGAGSGKTTTVVERIRYLVRERRVDPARILAVSFSRSAAGELSERLHAALGRRADAISVSTFHAFCLDVLQRRAYRAGIDPDLRVLDESAALTRFYGVYQELRDGRLGVEMPRSIDLLDERSLHVLYGLVTTLLEEGLGPEELVAREREVRASLLPPRGDPPPISVDGAMKDGFYRRKTPTANVGDPKADEARERLHLAPGRATLTGQLDDERRLAVMLAALLRRFDAVLAEHDEVTYAHLVAQVDRLLDDPRHRAAIRGRYDHCIVDEYQDTNAAQQRLIQHIFDERLTGVMLVGDPRQSIYGFRNARPEEIERLARSHGRAGIDDNYRSRQPILDAAWESLREQRPDDPRLVQRRDVELDGAETTCIAVAYSGRSAAPARVREAEVVAGEIARLAAEEGTPYGEIAILLRGKPHAREYVEALARRGIPARTSGGVGFYGTPEIEEALAWLRVADDPTDDAALLRVLRCGVVGVNEAAIATLTAASRAEGGTGQGRVDPGVRLARAALVDPLPATLDAPTRARLETLRAISEEVAGVPALPLAEGVALTLRASGLEHLYALRADEDPVERQAVANLRRLEEIAQSFARTTPDARIADFLRYLDALNEVAFDEREADPPAGDAVTIATIHWAKGREWRAVFVADVGKNVFPVKRPPRGVLWDFRERALIVTHDPAGAPTYHALRARYGLQGKAERDRWLEEARGEEERLFYVALTRARDRVYVCGPESLHKNGEHGRSPFLERFRGLEGVRLIEIAVDGAAGEEETPPAAQARVAQPSLFARDGGELAALIAERGEHDAAMRIAAAAGTGAPGEERALSFTALDAFAACPALYRYRYALRLPELGEEAIYGEHLDLGAGAYGTLIHAALERYQHERMSGDEQPDLMAALDAAIDDAGLRTRIGTRAAEARNTLRAYLAHPLAHARPLGVEVAFTIELAGTAITGAIDFVGELDGRPVIVDYKTGSGPLDHYGLQLAIYREAAYRLYGGRDWEPMLLILRDGEVREARLPAVDAEAAVATLVARLAERRWEPAPGDICRVCPYRGQPCRAYARAEIEGFPTR